MSRKEKFKNLSELKTKMDTIISTLHYLLSGDKELFQIITTTLIMALFSTGISSFLGIPIGILIGRNSFKGKKTLLKILNSLMALPPVVAGLLVFILFRSVGPLGSFKLMFSLQIMVIAQVVLITPVIISLTSTTIAGQSKLLIETAHGIGLRGFELIREIIKEFSSQILSIVLMGFGRSIAEVGAVSLVGGNIQFKTRVMTTAILLEANKGDFEKALSLGLILMLISLIVNFSAGIFMEKEQ